MVCFLLVFERLWVLQLSLPNEGIVYISRLVWDARYYVCVLSFELFFELNNRNFDNKGKEKKMKEKERLLQLCCLFSLYSCFVFVLNVRASRYFMNNWKILRARIIMLHEKQNNTISKLFSVLVSNKTTTIIYR